MILDLGPKHLPARQNSNNGYLNHFKTYVKPHGASLPDNPLRHHTPPRHCWQAEEPQFMKSPGTSGNSGISGIFSHDLPPHSFR
jgi:hypothetical protein